MLIQLDIISFNTSRKLLVHRGWLFFCFCIQFFFSQIVEEPALVVSQHLAALLPLLLVVEMYKHFSLPCHFLVFGRWSLSLLSRQKIDYDFINKLRRYGTMSAEHKLILFIFCWIPCCYTVNLYVSYTLIHSFALLQYCILICATDSGRIRTGTIFAIV